MLRSLTASCLLLLLLAASPGMEALAQPARPEAPGATAAPARRAPSGAALLTDTQLYYTTRSGVTIYRDHEQTEPYVRLGLREAVHVLSEGTVARVRTMDGAQGYVDPAALSNIWIRISKEAHTVFVYRGIEQLFALPADLGLNFFADKERRGSLTNPDDWRTPEGTFFVARKNPRSQFYKAFVLNYPNAEDAERGLQQGLISQAQYQAILQADRTFQMPPMNTPLGGWIEIHGDGTGARTNWTQGCVAIENMMMDRLWNLVSVGTPVLVEK